VSFIGTGTCRLDANQSGNADYTAATQVQQSFSVAPASQTVSFTSTAPTNAVQGGPPYSVSAMASSGLAVAVTVDSGSAGVCSISSNVVRFTGSGTCTLDANQAGNANYSTAVQVQQAFSVAAFEITTTSLPNATRGSTYSVQLQASGGTMPYKWKLIGHLPKGLKLHSTGLLTGTPSLTKAAPGDYGFTVQATTKKSKGHPALTATRSLTLTVM
jgi:hypothetical protein